MPTIGERLKHTWNAFLGRDPTKPNEFQAGSYYRPDRVTLTRGNSKSIVSSIYNRISVDVASINIKHVRMDDENDQFKEVIKSPLNNALTVSANIDQTGRALIQDVAMSMFDEGAVAIVPVITDVNPNNTEAYDIYEMRVGKIVQWYPQHVKVEVYNDQIGRKEQITLAKSYVAIIENPFYSIMNEPNSILQRLIRILNQIDRTNEQNSAGKMDLIIQLPYVVKSDGRKQQAEMRRKNIEDQLTGSQYGIAYIDGTERITQLNRSVENNLWTQAQDLTSQLYNQLGLTESIFNGTASEETMLDYYNRTIDPILTAITEEMERKFLSKTARTQRQAIMYFRDPFKLVPVKELAEIADKFTRNEIMTSNEIRSVVGLKPSNDPKADQLLNSNLNHPDEGQGMAEEMPEEGMEEIPTEDTEMTSKLQNEFDNLDI